ncbi:hypothetical protein COCON_G00041260 [Conger conger]|uniref:Ig-like domain-containing protein n=1 Tax=Conger conger TaxID=82655 RepID=A0A9Q1I2W7_CONCO|nr:hypothetical protein COCON_G00041260 [Conger conger]
MKRMLGPLLKLLLVLPAVSHGTATSCDISRDKPVRCYGTLGQSVSINLKTATNPCSGVQLEIKFNGDTFFRCKNGAPTPEKTCNNHCRLDNRTFRLENLTKSLSGMYSFEEFDKNGTTAQKGNIELIIQAPVSPPELSQLCQPHGEIRVWCSSTGEAPQYNWTLNDQPLDGGVAFLSNETQTVILKRDIPGSITCTVSNHVSKENTTQELFTCRGLGAPVKCTNGTEIDVRMNASLNAASLLNNTEIFFMDRGGEYVSAICKINSYTQNKSSENSQTTNFTCESQQLMIVSVALATCLVLLAILLVTCCCLYKKKQKQPMGSQRSNGDGPEGDPQELVYCQVQVAKKKDRPKKQQQVVYGEVKVSGRAKAARHSAEGQADTVYSGIRT